MKNKNLFKVAIIFLVITLSLIGIVLFSEKVQKIPLIENIKQAINKENINEQNNITTIDITGITPAPESEHEHIV